MNTEFRNSEPARKDNRMLIYGLFIAALLGTWGYIIYDKSKAKEEITTLASQNTSIVSERDEVRELYNSSLARLDSLMGENQGMTENLESRDGEIAKLKGEIRRILANKNASTAELTRARKMIGDLNGRIESLAAEVERLQGENEQLASANVRISEEKAMVEQTLTETTVAKETVQSQLEETRSIASTMRASNINILAIAEKNSGKEKETSTAKRADKLRITFDIDDNRIAEAGEKELYVSITAPDGTPVTYSAEDMFTTREGDQKFYTSKVIVNYAGGKKLPVSFDWKNDKQFQTGNYKIEIFHNGFKIGESYRSLKKSGLFG